MLLVKRVTIAEELLLSPTRPSSEREKSGRVERSTPVFLPGDDERGFERRVGVGSVLAVRKVC